MDTNCDLKQIRYEIRISNELLKCAAIAKQSAETAFVPLQSLISNWWMARFSFCQCVYDN